MRYKSKSEFLWKHWKNAWDLDDIYLLEEVNGWTEEQVRMYAKTEGKTFEEMLEEFEVKV